MRRTSKTCLLFASLCLLAAAAWCPMQSAQSYEIYTKIETYLVENVPEGESIETNLRRAVDWLDKLKEQDENAYENKQLIEALEDFVALRRVRKGNMCNRHSNNILLKNNRATGNRAHKLKPRWGALPRIEGILHHYNKVHALTCQHVYPANYKAKLATLNRYQLGQLESFLDDIIDLHTKADGATGNINSALFNSFVADEKSMISKLGSFKSLSTPLDSKVALEALRRFSRTHSDHEFLYMSDANIAAPTDPRKIRKAKVKGLFLTYLAEPCKYYVDHMGPDVFDPARYDLEMLESLDDDNSFLYNYYIGWARFQLCRVLYTYDYKYLVRSISSLAGRSRLVK